MKMALLNTTCVKYEHAVIGTLASTLNMGSMVLMFFPNFNVLLKDPNFSNLLKLQLQITGIEQIATAISASLHHQLVYRLQNHSVNLPYDSFTGLPAIITMEREDVLVVSRTPHQLTRDILADHLPLHWITQYEKLRKSTQPVIAADPTFQTLPDGSVKTSFKEPTEDTSTSEVFPTLMITPQSERINPKGQDSSQFLPSRWHHNHRIQN